MVKELGHKAVTTVRILQLWLACLKTQKKIYLRVRELVKTLQNWANDKRRLCDSLIRGFSEILLFNIIRPLFMVVFVDLSESLKSLLRNLVEVHNEFKTCYGDLVNYIQWKEIEADLHKHSDRLGYVLFFYKRKLCLQHKMFEVYPFKRQNRLFIEFTYWVNVRKTKHYAVHFLIRPWDEMLCQILIKSVGEIYRNSQEVKNSSYLRGFLSLVYQTKH